MSLTFWFDASTVALAEDPSLSLIGTDIPRGGRPRAISSPASSLRIAPRVTAPGLVDGTPLWAIIDIATATNTLYTSPNENGDNFTIETRSVRDGASSVTVTVGIHHTNTYVLTNHDTGAVLGVGIQSNSDTSTTIQSSAPLQVGSRYAVTRQSDGSQQFTRCLVRYGAPGTLVSGTTIEMGTLQVSGDWSTGSSLFLTSLISSHETTPLMIATALTFGTRDASGSDPVNMVGADQYVISTGDTLPIQISETGSTLGTWTLYDAVNIPSAASVIGQVLLLQALAVDPTGGVFFTDILGTTISP